MVLNQFLYIIDAYSKAAGKGKLEDLQMMKKKLFWQKI
jgi:hypothetical protein